MKNIKFSIPRHLESYFFKPVRKKRDIIRILIESIKIMLHYERGGNELAYPYMMLSIDKMKRLLFVSEKKVFSIAFPFVIVNRCNKVEFETKNGFKVDSAATSLVLPLINNIFEGENGVEYLYEQIISIENELDRKGFEEFLKKLVAFEDGYIRYDYDELRQDMDYHPLHHLDLYYSNESTFKIGCSERFDEEAIVKLMDVNSKVYYLS